MFALVTSYDASFSSRPIEMDLDVSDQVDEYAVDSVSATYYLANVD